MFVSGGPRYSEAEAREAIAASLSWNASLRRLGIHPGGRHSDTLKKYARLWGIPTDHFDPAAAQRAGPQTRAQPLEEILVDNSSYQRGSLKRRLLRAGLKQPICELCGQGEIWQGRRMSLILDHINGVGNDHRLENLQIVCPNCAATLDTHCGKNTRLRDRVCVGCAETFRPRYQGQRYCSHPCFADNSEEIRKPQPARHKVERPPYEQLMAELAASSYVAVGRKYGVSDNAVRKWVRSYERAGKEAA